MALHDRYSETILGELEKNDWFIYLGSTTSTLYVVESVQDGKIKYFISAIGKFDLRRNYVIDLNKPYDSYGKRYYRRVLKVLR